MRAAWSARPGRGRDRKRGPISALGPARDDGQARLTVAIYLVRHGETEWSLNGRHTGRTDLPLTPNGEQEAATLRPRLAAIKFVAVFSSPMQRALRTAEIAGFPGPQVTPLLSEVDYGDYEGQTSAAIHEVRPDWELYRDGCPGGETPAQIRARAEAFIELAAPTPGAVLAFGHGHILRAIAATWMRFDIMAAVRFQLDVASLSLLVENDHDHDLALWNAR